jgi:hypothetical protein
METYMFLFAGNWMGIPTWGIPHQRGEVPWEFSISKSSPNQASSRQLASAKVIDLIQLSCQCKGYWPHTTFVSLAPFAKVKDKILADRGRMITPSVQIQTVAFSCMMILIKHQYRPQKSNVFGVSYLCRHRRRSMWGVVMMNGTQTTQDEYSKKGN